MDANISYREAAVRGASPVRLVICLYQQAIEDLRRAVIALEKRDAEARTRAINHALVVIGQLQGTLDMERGGDVAKNLDRFYNVVRAGLVDAQFKQSAAILTQQIAQLGLRREELRGHAKAVAATAASGTAAVQMYRRADPEERAQPGDKS